MPKSATALKDLALQLADDGFDERVKRLVDAAERDHEARMAAAVMLTKPGAKAGTREHVAFTYISAAHAEIT